MALIDNLVSYWPCYDDAANTAVEDVHASSNLTASTNTSNINTTAGLIVDAFDLNGTSEEAKGSVTGLPTGSSSRSICAWIFPTVASGIRYAIGYGGNGTHLLFQIQYADGGGDKFSLKLFIDDVVSADNFPINNWYFVTGTYDGTTAKLYINGSLEGSGVVSLNTSSSDFFIGESIFGGHNFQGKICESMLFDTDISLSDHQDLYNLGAGLAYPFSAATLRQIKIGGSFADKPILTKVAGSFVDKPIKIKVGGTFQDA